MSASLKRRPSAVWRRSSLQRRRPARHAEGDAGATELQEFYRSYF